MMVFPVTTTIESNEMQQLAKKQQRDSLSEFAMAILFGKDYTIEISDTTKLNQCCQDICTPFHIDHMN